MTGSAPYPDGSITNKLHAHATAPLPDARDMNAYIPEAMVAVLQRMMAKLPADRYQNPEELLEDLDNETLTREGVTANLLAALAEEDPEEIAAPAKPPSKPKRVLPPRQPASKDASKGDDASPEGKNGKHWLPCPVPTIWNRQLLSPLLRRESV